MFSKPRHLQTLAATLAVALMILVPVRLTANGSGETPPPAETKTIVQVAKEGGFNTLAAAIEAAGLVATLESEGPFTVFAPTDEAFAALPVGTLEMLLQPENRDKLVEILTYHVVAGKVMAEQVVMLESAETVQGSAVQIETNGGSVMVNNATVTATDIQASNGVVHVIDTVLLPPSDY